MIPINNFFLNSAQADATKFATEQIINSQTSSAEPDKKDD